MLSSVRSAVRSPAVLRTACAGPDLGVGVGLGLGAPPSLSTAADASPYLHETRIPTTHFQDSLPKLPVPKLEDTLKKYEYFSRPLVSAEEHAVTQGLSASFLAGEGAALQEELVALDKQSYSCFYNEMWFDMYLESRAELPLNFNPQLTFKDETAPGKNDQAVRTANLIHSSLRFYRTLQDGKLEPDVFHTDPKLNKARYELVCRSLPRAVAFYGSYMYGGYPLDMSQYEGLFASTRLPHKGKDELRKFGPAESRHVVLQKGAAFYAVQVLDADMRLLAPEAIERAVRAVLADPAKTGEKPVGALSTMERDAWAAARGALEAASPANAEQLRVVDSALFAVTLDDAAPESYPEVSSCMLHGEGRNRWFDKSFQLVVAANGKAAVNFEHAWGDGVAVLRYFNEVYDDSTAVPDRAPSTDGLPGVVAFTPGGSSSGSGSVGEQGVPVRLSFDVDAKMGQVIDDAGAAFDTTVAKMQLGTFETEVFGKKALKELGVAGDGFMQMGFQLAHERMKGYTPSTYESASTAAFKHGRTETIRSATPEAAAFAKAFCDAGASPADKEALLRAAVKMHGSITKDALMGKGMDRHLFALRTLAARKGQTPALFDDKAYKVLGNIILSTSTLASDALFAGGFGPVNADCFALAYGISDDNARTAVATYGLGSQEFADHLDQAFVDMLATLRK